MIAVEGVTKRYGSMLAVDGLDFEVGRGEIVGFLGPNGSGKTTTMRIITGTLQPDSGLVLLDGRSIGEDVRAAKRRVGYLPESNPLYEDMLVCEYLRYAARLRDLEGANMRSAVREAADQTGLDEVFFRPISELSKGYRQRVGLAAAILHRPELLVLDEPTEGLDPNQRVEIRRLITELGRERTVLLSTHVMQEVEATCRRLLILNRGRLVADGNVSDLLERQKGGARYRVEAEGEGVAAGLEGFAGVEILSSQSVDGRTRVALAAAGEIDLRPEIFRMARDRDWVLWELHRERVSLEQVFHQLTMSDGTPAAPGEGTPEDESQEVTG